MIYFFISICPKIMFPLGCCLIQSIRATGRFFCFCRHFYPFEKKNNGFSIPCFASIQIFLSTVKAGLETQKNKVSTKEKLTF